MLQDARLGVFVMVRQSAEAHLTSASRPKPAKLNYGTFAFQANAEQKLPDYSDPSGRNLVLQRRLVKELISV